MLAQDGPSTRILYREIKRSFPACQLILEDPVSRWSMIKRRMRKLGLFPVFGQLLFLALAVPLLQVGAKRRLAEIKEEHSLDDAELNEPVIRVASVNSEELRDELRRLDPRVVVVNGTRIIESATLTCTRATFINTHAGITPRYRGVHGGYWALAEGQTDLVGTTIHLVDDGIDTGRVIAQATFGVTRADSFVTYPYLHTAAAVPLLEGAIRSCLDDKVMPVTPMDVTCSKLRYHPTLWFYLSTRLARQVR